MPVDPRQWSSLPVFALIAAGLALLIALQARRQGRPFWAALRAFFTPPSFPDEDQNRLARLLTTVLNVVLISTTLSQLLLRLLGVSLLPLAGPAVVVLLLAQLALVRQGRLQWVRQMLPAMLFTIVSLVIIQQGNLLGGVASGYLVVIALTTLLGGRRSAVVYSLLSLAVTFGLAAWQSQGQLAAVRQMSVFLFREWGISAAVIVIMAAILQLAQSSIQAGLSAERQRARQLQILATTARQLAGYNNPQEFLRAAAQRVHENFSFEHVAILLVEGDHLTLQAVHGQFAAQFQALPRVPLGRGLVGLAGQTGETALANDAAHDPRCQPLPGVELRADVALPLRLGKSVIGVMDVGSRKVNAFDPAEVHALESLADLLAAGLQSANLFTQLGQRERTTEALRHIGAAITASLDLPTVLNTLCAETRTTFGVDGALLWLLDEGRPNRMQVLAASGPSAEKLLGLAWDVADPLLLSARAIREGRPVFANDLQHSPLGVPQLKQILATQSLLAVPIIREAQTLGALAILDSQRADRFTSDDLTTAQLLGDQVAVAIQNARLHTRVQTLAATDGLTGLANRRTFDHALAVEVARALRYRSALSLVILDIDSFKIYNDTYGHPAGDERLKAIARLLQQELRESDIAARYGGEEMALILPQTQKEGALVFAERVRARAEAAAPSLAQPAPGVAEGPGAPIPGYTLSLGVATLPEDAPSAEALLLAADNAELLAKRLGKNRVCGASSVSDAILTPPGTSPLHPASDK